MTVLGLRGASKTFGGRAPPSLSEGRRGTYTEVPQCRVDITAQDAITTHSTHYLLRFRLPYTFVYGHVLGYTADALTYNVSLYTSYVTSVSSGVYNCVQLGC